MKTQNLSSTQSQKSLPTASFRGKSLTNQFDRLWQALVKFAKITREPKITLKRNRQGYSYFRIYDPVTGQHHYADSEQAVRIWLEQRYSSWR
jgi:hypothetical protein